MNLISIKHFLLSCICPGQRDSWFAVVRTLSKIGKKIIKKNILFRWNIWILLFSMHFRYIQQEPFSKVTSMNISVRRIGSKTKIVKSQSIKGKLPSRTKCGFSFLKSRFKKILLKWILTWENLIVLVIFGKVRKKYCCYYFCIIIVVQLCWSNFCIES